MRELLRKLGIIEGSDLPQVLSTAWQLHNVRLQRDVESEFVSRTSLLYAAAITNPRVLDALTQAGLNRERWEKRISLTDLPDLHYAPASDFQVNSAIPALEAFAEQRPQAPLDSITLTLAILEVVDAGAETYLKESGVDIPSAIDVLRKRVSRRNSAAASQIDGLFALRPHARTLLQHAAETIIDHNIDLPGVSTSMFLIALITTNSVPPDTSPRFLQRYIDQIINAPQREVVIDAWVNWYGRSSQNPNYWSVTEPMRLVLEQAEAIAHQVTGHTSEIQLRHLVGGLLTVPDTGAHDLLRELHVDLIALKRDYFTYLEEQGTRSGEGDDSEEWRRVLGVPIDQRWMPRFDAEGFGDDKLNIRRDVNAFAALLAAKNLTPPLSVGLFGDWGSGKSFFMSMLKAQIVRNSQRDKDTFHDRIVQIDFNAWHYVEADLWASLVEHIFRNLSMWNEKPEDVENRRNALLHHLDESVAAEAAAKENVARAEIDRDRVATKLEATKASVAVDAATLRDLQAQDIWELATIDRKDRVELRHALNAAGLAQAVSSTNDLRETFEQLQSIGTRTRLFWLTIASKRWTWIGLLLVALLAPIAGAVLAQYLRASNMAAEKKAIAEVVVRVSAFVTAFTLWLTPLLRGARKVLRRIDVAKAKVERRLRIAERNRQTQVDAQSQKLDDATSAVRKAQADLVEKERAVAKAKKALLDMSAGQQLAHFIDDRAASDDYRKLLGVLATVRGDFEKLSKLMKGQDGERMAGDLFRIDRIILYIDDLDRCHPDRVVDVLQAVHLLLAFPLFVVVVGVDARWVEESLRQKHSAFRDGAVPGYAVAPHDYLEKIFQVPFWLEPITSGGGARFIDRLVAAEIEELPSEETPAADEQPAPRTQSTVTTQTAGGNVASTTTSTQPITEDEATPPLKLQRKERDVMKLLSGLVGRSPRTVKRFVNTYRIIRAGVPARRIDALLDENPVGDYKAILLLLAIVAGVPTISVEVFTAIRGADDDTPVENFAKSLSGSSEVKRVSAAMTAIAKSSGGTMTIAHLREHLDNVSRYSFRRHERNAAA